MLGILRQSPPWYRDRLLEELQGRRTANTPWQKLIMTAYRAAGFLNRKGANCVLCARNRIRARRIDEIAVIALAISYAQETASDHAESMPPYK
ncbi:hypothetical protein V500_02576, partial [Pseudogymnoascus sp. VKM F-4518 (FW-2643)]